AKTSDESAAAALLRPASLVPLSVGAFLLLSPIILFPSAGVLSTGGAILTSVIAGRVWARRSRQSGNFLLALGLGIASGALWTDLWILDDTQLALARRIVERAFEQDDAAGPGTWDCPQCGEQLESQFEACWKCSTRRGAAVDEAAYAEASTVRGATRRPTKFS